MPLLSVPRELLLEIIRLVADSKPRPHRSYRVPYVRHLKHLAQTCRMLRSLSTTVIYSIIIIDRDLRALGEFLADYPTSATCIRYLKVKAPTYVTLENYWPNDQDLVAAPYSEAS